MASKKYAAHKVTVEGKTKDGELKLKKGASVGFSILTEAQADVLNSQVKNTGVFYYESKEPGGKETGKETGKNK